jgi:hypothetical protein
MGCGRSKPDEKSEQKLYSYKDFSNNSYTFEKVSNDLQFINGEIKFSYKLKSGDKTNLIPINGVTLVFAEIKNTNKQINEEKKLSELLSEESIIGTEPNNYVTVATVELEDASENIISPDAIANLDKYAVSSGASLINGKYYQAAIMIPNLVSLMRDGKAKEVMFLSSVKQYKGTDGFNNYKKDYNGYEGFNSLIPKEYHSIS